MATRESINDHYGERSLYVIEIKRGGKWSLPYQSGESYGSYRAAVRARKRLYERYKQNVRCEWKKSDFRITLYARVEG